MIKNASDLLRGQLTYTLGPLPAKSSYTEVGGHCRQPVGHRVAVYIIMLESGLYLALGVGKGGSRYAPA